MNYQCPKPGEMAPQLSVNPVEMVNRRTEQELTGFSRAFAALAWLKAEEAREAAERERS